MKAFHRVRADEHGQIFVMVALWAVALFGLCGLALDVGLMFVARAELRRDVDAAALASIVELPNNANVLARATEYLAANDPSAVLDPIGYNVPATGQITLSATKTQQLVFLPLVPGIAPLLIGGTSISLSGNAVAGAGSAMDLGMSIDDTGSMDSGCNAGQTNAGCPIKEARDGANILLNLTGVGDGTGVVAGALVPSRGCYSDTGGVCVDWLAPGKQVVDLTTTKPTLTAGIAALIAAGGSGTNICTGTHYVGDRVRNSPAARPTARKVAVVMSDFDNTDGLYAPFPTGTTCTKAGASPDARINSVDLKTYNVAQAQKALGVEYFVIGYSVEGAPSATLCNVAQVGTGTGRTSAGDLRDRNLGKCVASSTPGTNDHYFEAPNATDLAAAFTQVGHILSTRLLK